MGLIKRLLLLVLVVVVIGAGVAWGSKYLPSDWLQRPSALVSQLQPWIAQHAGRVNLESVGQTGSQLGGQLTSQVQSVTGKVLGVQTSNQASPGAATSQNASLPIRTLEFARYSYCKEVVTAYEARPR